MAKEIKEEELRQGVTAEEKEPKEQSDETIAPVKKPSKEKKLKTKSDEKQESKVDGVKKKLEAGTHFLQKTAHMIKEATEQFRLDAEYENPDRPEDVRYDDIITPVGVQSAESVEEEQEALAGEKDAENSDVFGTQADAAKAKVTEVKDKYVVWRILANLALTIVAVVLLIIFLPRLFKFFLPFIIAGILAAIATPLVKLIRKKLKMTQKLGSAIVIVLVIAAIVGALYGILYFVIAQGTKLLNDRQAIIDQVSVAKTRLAESEGMKAIFDILPVSVQNFISGTSEDAIKIFQEWISSLSLPTLSDASNFVTAGVDVLFGIIVTFIAAYFFTAQQAEIANWFQIHTPSSTMSYFRLIKDNFKKAVGGYFKAQFKIMLIMFAIMFIWFEIMDINYSALVAIGVAFLDFLPVFGMGAVLWPWIIIDIVAANYTEAILLGVLYGICQLIRQVLQPKLVSDAVEMNPLLTLIFMYVGYKLMNSIWGMILGIPIGMVIISLFRIGAFDRLTKGIKIIVKIINDFRKY
ncbi:MAG: AI-2E family transporter [Lachnospiraceae bacterium]|nr:AI-2E family transporter [Lachnospiraceae bacterium]